MSNEYKKHELEIDNLQSKKLEIEREINDLSRQYLIGAIGFFLGIVMLFVFWPLGALIGLAGMFSALTQTGKKKAKQAEIARIEEVIKSVRKKMMELL